MKKWIILGVIIIIAAGVAVFLTTKGDSMQDENKELGDKPLDYGNVTAEIKTNHGTFEMEFYFDDAPKAVENFVRLAQSGYYNGVTFHRIVSSFVIQAGDPTGTGAGGDSIYGGAFADELDPSTDSYKAGYKKGVVAMANRGANTNSSQFFIMLADNPLPNLYTIFGKVVKGQAVVDEIGSVPVDSDDRPVSAVVIQEVKIKDK